jgi:predicted hotdog family 3-hydroxylacyl-ACP dehydratase
MRADPLIAALVPHAGRMCLLERILDWDEDSIRCATATHLSVDHPLGTPHGLRSVHLCEYGAQAMALHGGLCARRDGRVVVPGMLVALRDVTLHVDDVRSCTGDLLVAATKLHASDEAWQYRFVVMHDLRELASGRATVALRRG